MHFIEELRGGEGVGKVQRCVTECVNVKECTNDICGLRPYGEQRRAVYGGVKKLVGRGQKESSF